MPGTAFRAKSRSSPLRADAFARCTLVCEVHACICKMHVDEVYAAVGAHLGDTRLGDARLQGLACL
jgi:hypothetical protein